MLKICIWMNITSHYQSAFFKALDARSDVTLQVRYLEGVSGERAAEGWNSGHDLMPYEAFCNGSDLSAADLIDTVEGWSEYIHIIGSSFSSDLIDWFCRNGVQWCHWSEMPGIHLSETLNYRMGLFRLLYPVMLRMKRKESQRIGRYAIRAFGQGVLAEKAFRAMGIPQQKISCLYYTPEAMPDLRPAQEVAGFANGRRVFLYVGALCRRKGIDVLLKAFASLKPDGWCLVLCGLDKEGGRNQQLADKLDIHEQVLFLGAYPADQIAAVYKASDVFVLPSFFDGWGAVLNEAASLNMPLIATDMCGASWHLIEEGVSGVRAKAGSVRAMRRAMGIFTNNPEEVNRMGAAAGRIFREAFTPERNGDYLVNALTGGL